MTIHEGINEAMARTRQAQLDKAGADRDFDTDDHFLMNKMWNTVRQMNNVSSQVRKIEIMADFINNTIKMGA